VIIKLKIAELVIHIEIKDQHKFSRYYEKKIKNFLYSGNAKPDIKISVFTQIPAPNFPEKRQVFISKNKNHIKHDWKLFKYAKGYIYESLTLSKKFQVAAINRNFNRIKLYFRLQKENEMWELSDLVYNFLQVNLINYLSRFKKGIFIHGLGIKQKSRGRGLLFTGKTGSGKTTFAKIVSKGTDIAILNDDRIIVRKLRGKYHIFSNPWYGFYSGSLVKKENPAVLKKVFFIYPSPVNKISALNKKSIFEMLLVNVFHPFWEKEDFKYTVGVCEDLVSTIPAVKFGFVNNKKVFDYLDN